MGIRAQRQEARNEVARIMPHASARTQRFEVDRRTLSEEAFREKHYFEDGSLEEAFAGIRGPYLDGSVLRRRSENMRTLSPENFRLLENILQDEGLSALLRTLRELADCRANADGVDMTFADSEDCEEWQHAADAIEELLADTRVTKL